jgi:hypothetical protein
LLQAFSRPFTFMGRQIVEDHHVALAQSRCQLRLNVDVKRRASDRAINDLRRTQFMAAQARDEGVGLPMTEGSACP